MTKFMIVLLVLSVVSSVYSADLLSAMGQALGLTKIENPAYQVVQKIDSITEIRKYEPAKWVSTEVAINVNKLESVTSSMFYKLFNFISKTLVESFVGLNNFIWNFFVERWSKRSKKIDSNDGTCPNQLHKLTAWSDQCQLILQCLNELLCAQGRAGECAQTCW